MKKVCVIILFIVIMGSVLNAQDFRKANWGMSKKQVKETEKIKDIYSEKEDVIVYISTLAGYKCMIGYIFTKNKLARAKYSFLEEHTNKNDYILDYDKILELLKKKYGKTLEENDYWKNDLFKDKYSDWGTAISIGHYLKYAKWEDEKTNVTTLLNGENYDISHVIEYSSKNLREVEQEDKEKEVLEDL